MSARTELKGETVAEELRFQYPHADIQVWILEMESYDSVIAFTERAAVDLDRLDMVILNAGTFDPDASVSNYTGHEKMFQVNCISTALLARLFVPVLKVVPPEREPSRLTVITDRQYNPSRYKSEPPGFGDLCSAECLEKSNFFRPRAVWKRYLESKMLLQLYLSKLATVVNPDAVTINLVTPYLVRDTQLVDKAMHMGWFHRSVGATYALVGRTLEKGAATYIDAVAVKGRESHGETISNCRSQPRIMDCCKPVEWRDFEESFWEMTESEFRSLFTGSQTLGAKIYNASMAEQWLRRSQA
ncbi:retinol dehydrogenase 12 [Fusarium langsethiae]|uniref:Retinol dehydrogenase 12 n=1 Tax=Fusarium langsethiae TaxID=179993 RepID=A0A0M9ES13_FUSLA|nr:retinol dehydrogenase 12 [Fusarium langsethiae]GKU05564.1 unnamed protein product [Fusarium langsethiae]GKU11400.1 unnamed protein product [Fusarium langsethiae]